MNNHTSEHEISILREQVKIFKKANQDNINRYEKLKKDAMILSVIFTTTIAILLFAGG